MAKKDSNDNRRIYRSRSYYSSIIVKKSIRQLIILGTLFIATFIIIRGLVPVSLPDEYIVYLQIAEIAIIGFFVIRVINKVFYKIIADESESQAKSIRVIIRISGYLIIVLIIATFLAKDTTVTVAITTATGIILGISMQSLIGNAIAGMVLAVVRPFKIGDTITVFGNTGMVDDIGLLYNRMITPEGRVILVPNTAMITTTIVKEIEFRANTGGTASTTS